MSKGKLLALCIVWLLIFGAGAVTWRLVFVPAQQARQEEAAQQALAETSADSRYRATIRLGLDSFSGYALLRHAAVRDALAADRVKWELVDDQANYTARLTALAEGRLQMAVFTIDALVKAAATRPDLPAVIVAMIDETRGADAMLAYQSVINTPTDFNHPETRFVVVADSPSETLARVVMSNLNLDQLAADPLIRLNSADEVFRRYQASQPGTREVFVLWEPYVSRVLENPSLKRVIDSSSFRGYIVDVLVASRDFTAKHPELVQEVIAAYFRAAHQLRHTSQQVVLEDARQLQTPLTEPQAAQLVAGIAWKNTQDNFAHFGLLDPANTNGVQHIEDMIANITNVLLRTKAIPRDPTDGKPNLLYYNRALAELHAADFHPGVAGEESLAGATELPTLTEAEWADLQPWGELRVPQLIFARGTPKLTEQSELVLDELVSTLQTWPLHYLLIRGNASNLGNNLEANRKLALQRAEAARDYLRSRGVKPERMRAVPGELRGESSVDFVLGQPRF